MTPEEQLPKTTELPIQQPSRPPRNTMNAISYVVSLVAVFFLGFMVAGAIGFDLSSDADPTVQEALSATFEALTPPPPTAVPDELAYSENDYFQGASDAPIVLVEFSDYRCPYCGHFAKDTLDALMQRYDGYVKFVYRDYPIFGDESIWASIAAQCADQQNMFWDYHHALFSSQVQDEPLALDGTSLTELATQLSMDGDEFQACLQDDTVIQGVLDNIDASYALLGNAPTPTFLLNGKRFSGALPFNDFVQIIDSELEALGVEPPAL